MESPKRIINTLIIILLTLSCLLVGKLALMPDKIANAAEPFNSCGARYRYNCEVNDKTYTCFVFDTSSGAGKMTHGNVDSPFAGKF